MTLVEMLIAVLLISMLLFLLIGWTNNLQQAAKRDLAVRLLADLDQALARYCRETGVYPKSYGPQSAIQATVELMDHARTRPILEALPAALWPAQGGRRLVDPWGTPLRYYAPDSDTPYVKANSGRPVFVSAGPDCDFGDDEPAGLGDNLRSDDPGPEGFKLYDAVREAALNDKEQQRAQEDD